MPTLKVSLNNHDLDVLFRSWLTVRGLTPQGPIAICMNGVNLGKNSRVEIEAFTNDPRINNGGAQGRLSTGERSLHLNTDHEREAKGARLGPRKAS